MPTTYVLFAMLVGAWMLLVGVFIWMHVPERTISEVVRTVESRRWISNGRAKLPVQERRMIVRCDPSNARSADRNLSERSPRSSRPTHTGVVKRAARSGMKPAAGPMHRVAAG